VPVLVRSIDREHAIELVHAGVDFQIRETFESALKLGERALVVFGDELDAATELMGDVRRRDGERFEIETVSGIYTGRDLIHGNAPGMGQAVEPEASS
jgi:CPA2 family monovalent cation:H+ antiporter-2/glutathione-regulated potassium-efflux system protein KefB